MKRVQCVSWMSFPPSAQAETVITVNQGLRGGKVVPLKQTVDQAVKLCPTVKRVFVSKRTDEDIPLSDLDIPLEEVRAMPPFWGKRVKYPSCKLSSSLHLSTTGPSICACTGPSLLPRKRDEHLQLPFDLSMQKSSTVHWEVLLSSSR